MSLGQDNHHPTPTVIIESVDYVPALVVVDMQNDFVSGSLAVPGAETIIPNVNALINLPFKAKIATKDFHPTDHVSFARTHGRPEYTTLSIYHPEDEDGVSGVKQTLWPNHCVAHTNGADFAPGVQPDNFDTVIHKGTHPSIESYSAFRDVWGRAETALPKVLREIGASDVYICGLAGDYCVKYTANDAVEYGYNTWVVSDAVKSISSNNLAWEEMESKGVKFTTVQKIKAKLSDT